MESLEEELKLIYSTDELIRKVSKPVGKFDAELRRFVDKMFLQLKEEMGIGLAAIQVGKPIRMFVIDIPEKKTEEKKVEIESEEKEIEKEAKKESGCENFGKFCMINPTITWKSDEISSYNEGCLSCPGVKADVLRPAKVKVEYFDEVGKKQFVYACGLLATCIQHENDHLNGILFVDHLPEREKNKLLEEVKEQIASGNLHRTEDPGYQDQTDKDPNPREKRRKMEKNI
jgi:peptide deformylase